MRAPFDFIGFGNYVTVLTDTERFLPAVGRTVYFTAGALIFEVVLGIAIALLLWKPYRGEKWVRVAILLPLVATPVAIGMMWRLIVEPHIGFANAFLSWFGIPARPWLRTFYILYATKCKVGVSFHEVETLNIYAHGLSFDYNRYGQASTVLILFFLMIIALIWILSLRKKAASK